jgi:hypothetical protein
MVRSTFSGRCRDRDDARREGVGVRAAGRPTQGVQRVRGGEGTDAVPADAADSRPPPGARPASSLDDGRVEHLED